MKPLENPIHFILHDSEGATTANIPTELRRHGYVEVQRTAQMQELANVPVTKRSINIDDNTRMEVSTYKNIYKVDIFLSKPFVEEDEDAIDSEVIEDGAKALFRVYSDKILVYDRGAWSVVDSWTEEDTDTTITLGAAYQPAIIPNESKGKAFVGEGKTVTSGLWGQSFFSPRFIDAGPGGVGHRMVPNETPPNDGQVVGETPATNNAMLQNTGFWLDGKLFPVVDGQTKSFPGGYDDVFAGNLIWDEDQQIGWFFIAKQSGQTSWEISILQDGIPYIQDINFTGPTHFEIWKLACYGDGREKLEDDEKDWTLADTVYLFTDGANEGLFNESTYWADKQFDPSPGLRARTPIQWGNFFPDGSFECPVSLIVDANQNTFTNTSAHFQDNDFYSSAGTIYQGKVTEISSFVGSVLICKRLRIDNVLSATSFQEQAELKSISPLVQEVGKVGTSNAPNRGTKHSDHVNGKGCLVKGLVLGNWYYEYRISTKAYPEAPTTKYYQREEDQFEIEYWLQLWKTYYPPPTESDLKTFEPQFVEQYLLGTGDDGTTMQRQFLFAHPLLPNLVAFDQCNSRYTYKPPPQDSIKIYLGATYKTNHFGEVVDETYAYDGKPFFSAEHDNAEPTYSPKTGPINDETYISANVSVLSYDYPYSSYQFANRCGLSWSLNRGPWGEWGRMNFVTFWSGTFEGRGWAAIHSEYGIPKALLEELDGVPPYIICMRRLVHLPRDHQVFSQCGSYGFLSCPPVLLKTQIDGDINANPDNPVCGPGYVYDDQYAYRVFSTYTEPLRVIEGVEPGLFAGSLDPDSPDLKYPLDEETYRWTYRFYSNCLTERQLQELTFDEETIDLIDKGETGLDQIPIYLGIL